LLTFVLQMSRMFSIRLCRLRAYSILSSLSGGPECQQSQHAKHPFPFERLSQLVTAIKISVCLPYSAARRPQPFALVKSSGSQVAALYLMWLSEPASISSAGDRLPIVNYLNSVVVPAEIGNSLNTSTRQAR
jgi:hypothetical protein